MLPGRTRWTLRPIAELALQGMAAVRQRTAEYLRANMSGTLAKESWKALGYATAAELEAEFKAFLARH